MDLAAAFAAHLADLRLAPGPALVAVSGGPDSMALLHLLAREPAHRFALEVGHVDHGIHPASGDVAARVAEAAAALGLPFASARLELGAGASETVAREARYRWLLERARALDAILFTAHHRDDQVETVLLRVLGGSGPAGLAGMAPVVGRLVRPLLPFGREEILAWLRSTRIGYWDDPANADPAHIRSWIRTAVLPPLRERMPDLDRRVLRLASQARQDRAAWAAALRVLPLEFREAEGGVSLRGDLLARYPEALGLALLQAAARGVGHTLGLAGARRALDLCRRGSSGRRAQLGAGWVAEYGFGRVRLGPDRSPPAWLAELTGGQGDAACGDWTLRWRTEPAPERQERAARVAWLAPGVYRARPWHAGDRVLPLGASGRRLVVRCMQDARVPRGLRPGWPVVLAEGEVAWVPGVMRSALRLPAAGQPALRVEATGP